MKLYALPIAAALMGAVIMTSTAQAAPSLGGALKSPQAGQSMAEEAGLRCRRICHGWGKRRHCKLVCRKGHRHHHHHRRHH